MSPTLQSLSPNLSSKDVNASVGFYTKLLGFTLIASVPETGKYNWAMLQREGATIMFQLLENLKEDMPSLKFESRGSLGTFFIEMKGVDELYKSLKGKVEIPMDMRTTFYGMREFVVQDPDGYYLMFAERTA